MNPSLTAALNVSRYRAHQKSHSDGYVVIDAGPGDVSKHGLTCIRTKVLAAGGVESREPQDYGFMYGRSFEDPDGHIWEVFWMDPAHVQGGGTSAS